MTTFSPGDEVIIRANTCDGERGTILHHYDASEGRFIEEHYVVRVESTGRHLAFLTTEVEAIPRDEHGNEATGVCMNCGKPMVENPMFPWCPECEEPDDE